MAFVVRGQLDYLDRVLFRLERIKEALRPAAIASACKAAGDIVLQAARDKARKRSGLMARSLGVEVVLHPKHGSVTVAIGPQKGFRESRGLSRRGKPKYANPLFYAHLVERGTRPHGYKTRRGQHPGARPYPFLAPALKETEGRVVGALSLALMEAQMKSI